jgi:hypothetical protein
MATKLVSILFPKRGGVDIPSTDEERLLIESDDLMLLNELSVQVLNKRLKKLSFCQLWRCISLYARVDKILIDAPYFRAVYRKYIDGLLYVIDDSQIYYSVLKTFQRSFKPVSATKDIRCYNLLCLSSCIATLFSLVLKIYDRDNFKLMYKHSLKLDPLNAGLFAYSGNSFIAYDQKQCILFTVHDDDIERKNITVKKDRKYVLSDIHTPAYISAMEIMEYDHSMRTCLVHVNQSAISTVNYGEYENTLYCRSGVAIAIKIHNTTLCITYNNIVYKFSGIKPLVWTSYITYCGRGELIQLSAELTGDHMLFSILGHCIKLKKSFQIDPIHTDNMLRFIYYTPRYIIFNTRHGDVRLLIYVDGKYITWPSYLLQQEYYFIECRDDALYFSTIDTIVKILLPIL